MVAAVPGAMNGLWAACIAPGGDVWLSLFDGFFAVIRNDRLVWLKDQNAIGYWLCDKNGSVWLRNYQGIVEVQHDRVKLLPLLPVRAS
jgi:hypothetical protein